MNEFITKPKIYMNSTYQRYSERRLSAVFLFTLFVLPQYFGIQVGGYDLTALRIMAILFLIYIIESRERFQKFISIIDKAPFKLCMFFYLCVLAYTAVLRINVNTILQTVIEFTCLFIVSYIILEIYGVEDFIALIMKFLYVLTILGIVEFFMKQTPFAYLEAIPGLYTGGFIRSGVYRVMGPCNHSLGYGLLLITVFPMVCLNVVTNKLSIMHRPILCILIIINIFMTGSRSTLAVFFLELFLLFIFSERKQKKAIILGLSVILLISGAYISMFLNTEVAQYIMRQVCSVFDSIFDTQYAANFGADMKRLADSARTRELTLQIFNLDWLNPLLGRGLKRGVTVVIDGWAITSVDNFYVCQYIRFAYPGLVLYGLFIIITVVGILKEAIRKKSGIKMVLFISIVAYFVNLWFLDTLQTLKYVYIQFAIYVAVIIKENALDPYNETNHYKYFKQKSNLCIVQMRGNEDEKGQCHSSGV